MLRGRLHRPKPNLSRAVGKKSVLSQGKADTENKNSLPETVEKVGSKRLYGNQNLKIVPRLWGIKMFPYNHKVLLLILIQVRKLVC